MSKNRIYATRTLSQMEINRRHQDKVASIDNELNAAIAKIDWKRRKKAERSLYDWCCEYMVGLLLNTPPPPKGKEVLDEMD